MWIEGNLEKSGKYWAVSIAALEVYTQGRTKKEAYFMGKDALEGLAEADGFDLDILVIPEGSDHFRAGSNDAKAFTAFVLRRWRQAHNLTLAEAAERLGSASKNAYARYEQGRSEPTISMMERLIRAISPGERLHVLFGS